MKLTAQQKALADHLHEKLANEGRIIEGGWQVFEHLCLKGAPDEQKREMKKAWFGSAQHLWSCIFKMLDGGSEPTDKDMNRMSAINTELTAWCAQMEREYPNV